MGLNVFNRASHRYLEGTAFIIMAVVLGGCSSDFTRFTDGIYTGSTPAQQVIVNKTVQNYQQMPPTAYDNMHNVIASGELPPVPAANPDGQEMQTAALGVGMPLPGSAVSQKQPTSLSPASEEQHIEKTTRTTKHQAYVVQSGDTLYAIARKHDTNVKELKRENGLDGDLIRIGQALIVPGTAIQVASATAAKPVVKEPAAKPVQEVRVAPAVQTKVVETITVKPEKADEVSLPKAEKAIASTADITQEAKKAAVIAPQATGLSKMRWPVRGRVLSHYGQREGTATNDGMDIIVPEGTSVKAAESGTVIYAGDGLKEFGKTILIRHEDNVVTVYGHNSKILVQRGQQVHRGDEIAKSGISGNASTPKLHFEVRKNSTPVNPVKYLEN